MKRLGSYLCGEWQLGERPGQTLVNPSTEEVLAETGEGGWDLAACVRYAREKGGASLRQMTFAERGALLAELAKCVHAGREELIALAIANGGNTRGDAKFDIDGAAFTLAHYAELGAALGDRRLIADGEPTQIGRTARFSGQHILSPRLGVAAHINAFNFPAWGLAEKAACALLAGVPVISKPASATALVAHRLAELFVEKNILPPGAFSLTCGSARELPAHLGGQDVLAFTGSSATAAILRASSGATERSVHVNVEADSLNAAVLGPDVSLSSETGQLFLADVARDITQKTGQKCTAIRRVLVPQAIADEVAAALRERLEGITIGNPAESKVRMGPLATAQQLGDVRAGIERLDTATTKVYGEPVSAVGAPEGKGFFVGPTLFLATDPAAKAIHEDEVFGPVATLLPYSGAADQASEIVALGSGGLVASLYSDDREFLAATVGALAPHHGRLYLGSEKIAAQSAGPGTVLPSLLHGGPGRAGWRRGARWRARLAPLPAAHGAAG